MKIAMFGHKHFPSREGGIEVVVRELALRMAKHHQITIYDRYEIDKAKRSYPTYKNIKIKESPTVSTSKLNAMIASFFSTIQTCFSDADIVHIHAEGPSVFIPLLKMFHKNVIVTIHGLDWQRTKWNGFAKRYIKLGEYMAAKYADEMIVLSEDIKKYFKTQYNRETILINNGVNVYPTKEYDKIESFGLKNGEYILYLGRIVPEKRVDLLVDAYLRLDTNKKLVIAGQLNNTEYMQEIRKKTAMNHNIIFTDYVKGQQVRQLYSNCFLFVLPSDLEGMSISLLEALGYGVPCLMSDIPENIRVANGFGNTFKAGDVDSLHQKLTELLRATYHPLNKKQLEFVKDTYNWDKITEKTLSLYKKVLEVNNERISNSNHNNL